MLIIKQGTTNFLFRHVITFIGASLLPSLNKSSDAWGKCFLINILYIISPNLEPSNDYRTE